MLNSLFAACGMIVGTVIVGGALLGAIWLAATYGGVLGWAVVAFIAAGWIAG